MTKTRYFTTLDGNKYETEYTEDYELDDLTTVRVFNFLDMGNILRIRRDALDAKLEAATPQHRVSLPIYKELTYVNRYFND